MSDPSEAVELAAFESSLLAAWPWRTWGDVTVMVAVSGGPDSVALLRAMQRLRERLGSEAPGELQVLHFNHRWRQESADDEAFVEDLCVGLGLRCHRGGGERPGSTSEEFARRERYDFFRAAAESQGARYVATGHTHDDQAETVLHRIVRGTGLTGLAGIRRCRALSPAVSVVRPLLAVSRREVLKYLATLRQGYQVDATNADERYTRNRLRNEILPLLARTFNPEISSALTRLGRLAADAQEVVEQVADRQLDACLQRSTADGDEFDVATLRHMPAYLRREVLALAWRRRQWPQQAMGFPEWSRLVDMIDDPPTKLDLPGGIVADKTDATLRVYRRT